MSQLHTSNAKDRVKLKDLPHVYGKIPDCLHKPQPGPGGHPELELNPGADVFQQKCNDPTHTAAVGLKIKVYCINTVRIQIPDTQILEQ